MLDVSEESVSVDDNDDEVALLRFRFRDMGAARGEGVLCSFFRQQLSEGVLCSEPLSCLGGFISSILDLVSQCGLSTRYHTMY